MRYEIMRLKLTSSKWNLFRFLPSTPTHHHPPTTHHPPTITLERFRDYVYKKISLVTVSTLPVEGWLFSSTTLSLIG